MNKDNHQPKRKPTHLTGIDYNENGRYFLTICTYRRKQLLAKIIVGEGLAPPEIKLTALGRIAEEQLLKLNDRFNSVEIEKYVIMPNHIHVILRLDNSGGASPSPTTHYVIGAFKSLVTRECRNIGYNDNIWQRSYNDRVIRDEKEFYDIWEYIENNPAKWADDKYYGADEIDLQ